MERDQKDFIQEATIKLKAKEKLKEIEEECKAVIDEFEEKIEAEDYRAAHKRVIEFRLKYDQEYNLNSIPMAKQIILMDENLGESITKETNRIKNQLKELYQQVEEGITNESLGILPNLIAQAEDLRKEINEIELDSTWHLVEDQYRKAKRTFREKIIEMTNKARAKLEEKQISDAKNIFETIVKKLENAF